MRADANLFGSQNEKGFGPFPAPENVKLEDW